MTTSASGQPARTLSVADAIFMIVGLVVGAGIFRAPSLVAANTANSAELLLLWIAGGVIALIGALCYAELASAFPSTGGDYHFLQRAFGRGISFLFAWARLAIMQTGSIALLAFILGDYASEWLSLGPYSAAIYAAVAVVLFTGVNLIGIREGKGAQRLFTVLEVAGVVAIALGCLLLDGNGPVATQGAAADGAVPTTTVHALGAAMVFVLLTYGGWNEGAYVSSEIAGGRAAMARVLVLSLAIVMTLYLLINLGYLRALGHDGMAASGAVASDAARRILGSPGAAVVGLLVAVSALTSMNATIITGARCNHAVGRDFHAFRALGGWHARGSTPRNGLILQGAIVLLLIAAAATTRAGFATLVEYTAPVFWLFFFLTGVALFRLRRSEPDAERPFRVPLYPLTPLVFCATSLFMAWASIRYTGLGALAGVAILLAGAPIYWLIQGPADRKARGDIDERSITGAATAGGAPAGDHARIGADAGERLERGDVDAAGAVRPDTG